MDDFFNGDSSFNLPDEDVNSFDNFGEVPDNSENNTRSFSEVSKKVTVLSVVLGLALILAVFFVWGRVRNTSDVQDNTVENPVESVDNIENVAVSKNNVDYAENDVSKNVVNSTGSTNETEQSLQDNSLKNNTQIVEKNGAVEINSASLVGISEPKSGYFTVTDIKTYAKNSGDNSGNYIISTIYGNITGLTGVYELTIPTESTYKIKVGDIVDVSYTTVSLNGNDYVVDIR